MFKLNYFCFTAIFFLYESRTQTCILFKYLAAGNLTSRSDDSRNTLGPSLTLDIDHLLKQFTDTEREDELQQVTKS